MKHRFEYLIFKYNMTFMFLIISFKFEGFFVFFCFFALFIIFDELKFNTKINRYIYFIIFSFSCFVPGLLLRGYVVESDINHLLYNAFVSIYMIFFLIFSCYSYDSNLIFKNVNFKSTYFGLKILIIYLFVFFLSKIPYFFKFQNDMHTIFAFFLAILAAMGHALLLRTRKF